MMTNNIDYPSPLHLIPPPHYSYSKAWWTWTVSCSPPPGTGSPPHPSYGKFPPEKENIKKKCIDYSLTNKIFKPFKKQIFIGYKFTVSNSPLKRPRIESIRWRWLKCSLWMYTPCTAAPCLAVSWPVLVVREWMADCVHCRGGWMRGEVGQLYQLRWSGTDHGGGKLCNKMSCNFFMTAKT